MNDELCQRKVELVVGEWQRFDHAATHIDVGLARADSRDKCLGRVDCRHRRRAQSGHEFLGQCARTTADVECSLPGSDTRQRDELSRQRPGESAHEPVVRRGINIEAHPVNLGRPSRPGNRWSGQAPAAGTPSALSPLISNTATVGGELTEEASWLTRRE